MSPVIRHSEAVFRAEALPHVDALYRVACRILHGNEDEAADLVQEVVIQAWKSFDSYESGTNCKAWLFAILYNKSKHVLRKLGNRKVIPLSDHAANDVFDNVPAPPPVPDRLTDEEVLAALDTLPEHYRDIILLADVEGFTYRDIAEILDVPPGTVMSRLSRARSTLRQKLCDVALEYGVNVGSSRANNG